MAAVVLMSRYDRINDRITQICNSSLPKKEQLFVRQELLIARISSLMSMLGVQVRLQYRFVYVLGVMCSSFVGACSRQ